jgi:cytochrome b
MNTLDFLLAFSFLTFINTMEQKKPELKTPFSNKLALWHWGNLIVIALILITVFMVKNLFNGRAKVPLVQAALEKKGIQITVEQARSVTRIYSRQLWDWHVYLGFVLCGFLVYRILVEFLQPKESRLLYRWREARAYAKTSSEALAEKSHALAVKSLYALFYLALTFMVCSGLFMHFSEDYPNLHDIKEVLEDLHGAVMYVILSFIVLHLGGLFLHQRKTAKNL